jgi:predicted DNA-binding transcriptional regulator AlpA
LSSGRRAWFAARVSEHPDGLEDLVTRARIGRRLQLTRARTDRAIASPGFPAPLGRLGTQVVWRWADVRAWAERAEGRPEGPTPEGMRLAEVRDRFRGAGFRLKIAPDPSGGWQAVRVAAGQPSSAGEVFRGDTALEAAESALDWLETHH